MVLTVIVMFTALVVLDHGVSDAAMLGLGALPCAVLFGWLVLGAPLLREELAWPIMFPLGGLSFAILMTASDRYAMLHPFWIGLAVVLATMAAGLGLLWLVLLTGSHAATHRTERFVFAGILLFVGGIVCVQPELLLANAAMQSAASQVIVGHVAGLKVVRGKHTSYLVRLTGAAHAWSATGTSGEFTVERAQFETIHSGDRQCLTIRSGMLHWQWWTLDDCGIGARIAAIQRDWASGDHAGAMAALESLVHAMPEAVNAVTPEWIDAVRLALASSHDTAMLRRLLVAIDNPAIEAGDNRYLIDNYRLQLALLEVNSGDPRAAAAALGRIDDPVNMLWAALDPRLAGLVPPGFDARAAIFRAIAREQAAITAAPDTLGPVLRLARSQAELGDGPALVALMRATKPGPDHPQIAATDAERRLWWWLLADGYALQARLDDAIATLRHSMARGQINAGDAETMLRLAGLQRDAGYPRDALATLASPVLANTDLTEDGRAEVLAIRACARHVAGDIPAANADVGTLRNDHKAGVDPLLAALACTGHDDEAAALLIDALRSPVIGIVWRLRLSTFTQWPGGWHGTQIQRDLARLVQRPDVQAALARAGGTGHFDIPPI